MLSAPLKNTIHRQSSVFAVILRRATFQSNRGNSVEVARRLIVIQNVCKAARPLTIAAGTKQVADY
jgi:predicted RNase H-like nuclease